MSEILKILDLEISSLYLICFEENKTVNFPTHHSTNADWCRLSHTPPIEPTIRAIRPPNDVRSSSDVARRRSGKVACEDHVASYALEASDVAQF
ncbi:unnamed protein product [Larinioides sclopetarius]|uniref:Uncharacterized protein n=1 Tax=Larinioides sclopetarius TaxID=280406 RepID=A0AAV2A746_9ARAC